MGAPFLDNLPEDRVIWTRVLLPEEVSEDNLQVVHSIPVHFEAVLFQEA